jgi:hypothetical protein
MASENPRKIRAQSAQRAGRRPSASTPCPTANKSSSTTAKEVLQQLRRQELGLEQEFSQLDLQAKGSFGSRTGKEDVTDTVSRTTSLGREVRTLAVRVSSAPIIKEIDDKSDYDYIAIDERYSRFDGVSYQWLVVEVSVSLPHRLLPRGKMHHSPVLVCPF